MKIVVIGGSGLIGTKLVHELRSGGHDVVAAARSTGVNAVTGEGLSEALSGASVVVDVANSPSFEEAAAREFFAAVGRNLQAAEQEAGVKHHVALSVVGVDRLPDNGYFRAKVLQEELIKSSGIPYTILRATQFYEFVGAIAQAASEGESVRLSPARMQPVAAADVVATLAELAVGQPLNDTLELAGPEPIPMNELVQQYFQATGDRRAIIVDPQATYFGSVINDQSLTPGHNPRRGPTTFTNWLTAQ